MTDPTDLSKLSSDEIIGKIVSLAMDIHGLFATEVIEKYAKEYGVLKIALNQAVIREATVKEVKVEVCESGESMELVSSKWIPAGTYALVKQTT